VWIRKIVLAASLSPMLVVCSNSQQMSAAEEAITRIINKGFVDGHDNKVIGGIGDPAAVIVTKVVRGRHLTSSEIDTVLIVLNMAFGGAKPGPDAEPKTALFVFRELELSTNDAQLRARIEQSRKYAEEEFSKSTKASPPN
jgi:hypothetical protein